jgi:hypothetical protein
MSSKNAWIMGAEQVTIPEGMVKGPERVLPRNSVFKLAGVQVVFAEAVSYRFMPWKNRKGAASGDSWRIAGFLIYCGYIQ